MAAKTGTTQGNADAWLAGYTPNYTAIVWMGNVDGNRPMDDVDGQPVFGGSVPAQIWHDFMVEALSDVEPVDFAEPDLELLNGRSGAIRTASEAGPTLVPETSTTTSSSTTTATTTSTTTTSSTTTTTTTTTTTEPSSTSAPPTTAAESAEETDSG